MEQRYKIYQPYYTTFDAYYLVVYRKQDDQLLKEINTLISSKKSSDEMSIINFDINNAKKMLKEWSSFSAPVRGRGRI
jgi:hypothetical protein